MSSDPSLTHPPADIAADTPGAADPRRAEIVFYDGGCPVCRREIGWYREMRGADAMRWIDVLSPDAPLPAGRDRSALLKRFTVARADGAVVTGAEAFASMWRGLGPTRWLGRLVDRQPLRTIAELAYRAFLRLRRAWR